MKKKPHKTLRFQLRACYDYCLVQLTVHYDELGKVLNPRNVARSKAWGWGEWQSSGKIKTSYGPAWWCSTPGHGGVILVSDKELPFERKPAYSETIGPEHGLWVYEFEEDCDWAVLAYMDPIASESMRLSKWTGEVGKDKWDEMVLGCVGRWNKELLNG